MMKNFSTPWTREFLLTPFFSLYLAFFLSTYAKALAFLCSDNEDPNRDATNAPSIENRATDEPSMQEVVPVVKPSKASKASKAPVKKPTTTCGSKHLKQLTDAGASLEAHQSTSSSGDVRVDTGMFSFISCFTSILTWNFWTDFDEEVCHFGH
jgi:hypothetical protein